MKPWPLRLPPNADLRGAIEDLVAADGSGSAFVVAGIGSLREAKVRFAGASQTTRLVGAFEILTLSGTVTRDGAHLHISVADAEGRVLGGHAGYGNIVRTTAEILCATLPGWRLRRALDAATGYEELSVHPDE